MGIQKNDPRRVLRLCRALRDDMGIEIVNIEEYLKDIKKETVNQTVIIATALEKMAKEVKELNETLKKMME